MDQNNLSSKCMRNASLIFWYENICIVQIILHTANHLSNVTQNAIVVSTQRRRFFINILVLNEITVRLNIHFLNLNYGSLRRIEF